MPPIPRVATYKSTVIWGTGTDVDTSEYDDVTPYALNSPGFQIDGIGRDQIRAYAPPATPAFDQTLTNWTRRFSPGGAIGSMVGRGARTYFDLSWGLDQNCNSPEIPANEPTVLANGRQDARLFDGYLNTAEHTLTRPQRSVQLRALGHMATLLDKKPRSGQLYENIRTDEAIAHMLDAVGWPADKRVIDSGDTRLLYWWMDGEQTGLDVLLALLGAEGAGGCAYEQNGTFHFEGRSSRSQNARSLEPQWVFTDGVSPDPNCNSAGILANDPDTLANGQAEILLLDVNPSETQSNPDEVVASVAAQVNVRLPVPEQIEGGDAERGVIWQYGGPLTLAPGEVRVTEALLSDPYKLAQTPVRRPDTGPFVGPYDYVVSPPGAAVTVTLLQDSGIRVRIQWANGGVPVTIDGDTSDGPQLRAVSLPVASQVIARSTVDTSAFAPRYAGREMQWAMWPEVAVGDGTAICNSMCRRYMQERRQATIRVANLDGRHMLAMMQVRVSDRVVWVQKHGEINDPYWVEQIAHDISPGGGLHVMTLGLERVFDTVGTRFDATPGSTYGFGVGHFGD